ncbi:MAG: hypothetical protein JXR63_02605 [Spirochaetales bacterium]|nr:hypothetical protein [Spirochaetales bacterium]
MKKIIYFCLFILTTGCSSFLYEKENVNKFMSESDYYTIQIDSTKLDFFMEQKETLFDRQLLDGSYKPLSDFQLRQSLNGSWQVTAAGKKFAVNIPAVFVLNGVPQSDEYLATKEFTVDSKFSGKKIILRFETVYSEAEIFVNENRVGFHEAGFTAFDIDITEFLQEGKNSLSVKIKGKSLSDVLTSGNKYAAHDMAGILRDVYLFPVEKNGIISVDSQTDTEDYNFFKLLLKIKKSQLAEGTITVKIPALGFEKNFEIQSGSEYQDIEISDLQPELWDCDNPNLYNIIIQHKQQESSCSFVIRTGFREVKVSGNKLLVNNKEVKLAGVNRHSTHPNLGRAINDELRLKDVLLFKEANVNYIRTSHYPPARQFLEYCDAYGMFVEVEAPLCWVGHAAIRSSLFMNLLRPNIEMIKFNRNHPSIIFWSLANESSWSRNFADVYAICKELDTTRPFTFHDQAVGGYNNKGSYTGVANHHYPGPDVDFFDKKVSRPLLFGEYSHVNVYNRQELVSDPGLREQWGEYFFAMWEKMYAADGIIGGAIWSGIDDYFVMDKDTAVGYGPWGVIDGYRRKKPEFWNVKKTYSPFRQLVAATDGRIEIAHRLKFSQPGDYRWFGIDESGREDEIFPTKIDENSIIFEKSALAKFDYFEVRNRNNLTIDAFSIKEKVATLPAADYSWKLTRSGKVAEISSGNLTLKIEGNQFKSVKSGGVDVKFENPRFTIVPLKGEGCFPAFRNNIEPSESTAVVKANLITEISEADGKIIVKILEKNSLGSGAITLTFGKDGIAVVFDFAFSQVVNIREAGLKFITGTEMKSLSWERSNFFTYYPADHIGRLSGTALLDYPSASYGTVPFAQPKNSFARDNSAYGSNDFRAGRTEARRYSLSEEGVTMHFLPGEKYLCRAMRMNQAIELSICPLASPGRELFFNEHLKETRIKPAKLSGECKIVID